MSVKTVTGDSHQTAAGTPGMQNQTSFLDEAKRLGKHRMGVEAVDTDNGVVVHDDGDVHRMGQMGAKRIGSLAIGIGVVGIVLNEMSSMDMVANSTGVVDVSSIFETAGSGLSLLVLGVIIAAAAVLLSLWGNF